MEREGRLLKGCEGGSAPSHLQPLATLLQSWDAAKTANAPAGHALPRPLQRTPSTVPPTGPEVRTRTGKMEAAAEPLRSVRLLSRVLLFLSQCYVLSGDGEFKVGDRSGQAGGPRNAEGRRQTTGRHSPPGPR